MKRKGKKRHSRFQMWNLNERSFDFNRPLTAALTRLPSVVDPALVKQHSAVLNLYLDLGNFFFPLYVSASARLKQSEPDSMWKVPSTKTTLHPAPHVTPLLLSLAYLAGLPYNTAGWNDLDSLHYPSARMDRRQCKQRPLEDTDKVNKDRRSSKWCFYKFFFPLTFRLTGFPGSWRSFKMYGSNV